MPVGVTFGSVGDIISLSIVIKDLVKALDDSRGSSAEYREITRELWALDRVLLEVELLWRTCESTIELNALRETARRMTDQCRCSIEGFLAKVQKYGSSLSGRGSEKVIRDFSMKIRWQVAHSDELTKFRAEINAHCSAISMLLVTASVNLTKLNDKRLHARLSDNDARIKASSDEQQLLLREVKDKLDENNNQIRALSTVTTKISESLRLGWIRQLGEELKGWMRKIYFVHMSTYKAVVDIRGRLPSQLERVLYQEPFILEDGIGRIAPVHMQFICSWEAFDSVLELRFRNMQGYTMVQNKEYVIQESSTRREIDRSFPWEASFLPGQKVVMSMLFNDTTSSTTSCPRCQFSSEKPHNSDIQCSGCGMWYRRIIEYNYVDPPPPANQIQTRKLQEAPAVFGQGPFKAIVFGPPPSNDHEDLMGSGKRKSDQIQDNDIARFKRVRILSKKTRVRGPVREPFTRFVTESKGFKDIAVDQVYQRIESKAGQTIPQALLVTTVAQISSLPPLPPAFKTIFTLNAQHLGHATKSDTDDAANKVRKDSDADYIYMRQGQNNTDKHKDSSFIQDLEYHSSRVNGLSSSSTQHLGRATKSDKDNAAKIVSKDPNTNNISSIAVMRYEQNNTDKREASSFNEDFEYHGTSENEPQSSPKSSSGKEHYNEYLHGPRYIKDEVHHAVCYGNLRRLQQLLYDGVGRFMHIRDALLYQAVFNCDAPTAQFLLENMVDVNARHSSGWTALMRAAENGDAKLVSKVLRYGAYPSMWLAKGQTALHLAAAKGHGEVVEILLANSPSKVANNPEAQAALLLAVINGYVAAVSLLLEHGVEFSTRDAYGRTLLHRAAWNGCKPVAQLLLSKGLGVDVKDYYGQSALHKAAACGEEDMVWLLWAFGAELNARDDDGCTPLDLASENGFEAVAEILMRAASKDRVPPSDIMMADDAEFLALD